MIPEKLNNPFGGNIPEIGRVAAREFQDFIAEESKGWGHDFKTQKGKMFGVLVVETENNALGYIATASGKLHSEMACEKFIPSAFDDATDISFIDTGMQALTEMGAAIRSAVDPEKVRALKRQRKQKSVDLQRQLFANYDFMSLSGKVKNVMDIFEDASLGNPPSAAGDCAAPKLLHFAFKHRLNPLALAEFWWGNAPKNREKVHKNFYPACKSKCRPVLEYMLEDEGLYQRANAGA